MEIPKYLEIKNDIKDKIINGVFVPGEKIYSENELKKQYGVSSTTVVKAIQELVNEGYLTRRQGTGTFVRRSMMNKEVILDENTHHPKGENRLEESIQVKSITEITSEEVAEKLGIDKADKIIHFVRVRYINKEPWNIQNTYIAKKNLKDIDLDNHKQFNSISNTVKSLLKIDTLNESMKERISIAYPPPGIVKQHFGLEKDLPVYHIKRITYYPEKTPFEYVETFIHYEYYSLGITRNKK
ncbi:GntR family transcriptional regulator [Mesobacillus zeae]|uniref:GntR family transcriptional regulator n=1 Tax=Mesobacillus zeae TaxID=1917180 RepID=A0A398AXM4_9BACI|nr:GntR family transcriptional regulator [Mesobacillus zeae]RID82311.1 GntR family transcriptional regulator [Mesobacillus zeae]